MELENIILSEVSQAQKTSHVDFRFKRHAVILLDMGHTLRGEHIKEE
jgi:hypothetical protein